jgi:hypothetical protein
MKKIIFIAILLIPSYALALGAGFVGLSAGAGVGSTADFCAGYSGIACEDFEGSSDCGDDANSNCRLSWTGDANGTFNNQATGLAGTYAKLVNDTSGSDTTMGSTRISFDGTNSVYAFALINISTLTITGNTVPVLQLSGSTANCLLRVAPSTYNFNLLSNAANGSTSVNAVAGTTYAVWLEYNNNTADTGCSAYIAEATCSGTPRVCTATKPALSGGVSTNNSGTVTSLIAKSLDQVSFGDVDPVTFDNLKVQATAIGDNGE